MLIKKIDRYSGSAFILSFALLPFFKLITGVLNVALPIYYLPIFLTCPIILVRRHKLDLKFWLLNSFSLAFILIGLFSNKSVDLASLKIIVAAVAFINSGYALLVLYKDDEFYSEFVEKLIPIIKKLSYAFLAICFFSFVFNLLKNPIFSDVEEIIKYLKFDRSSNVFRYQILLRFNPIGLINNDIPNIRYIGQQLLLLPLAAYIISAITGKLKKTENICFLFVLILAAFIVNSRGLILTIVVTSALLIVKSIPYCLHKIYSLTAICVPLSLTLLKGRAANGRECQFNFVKNHISVLGNGIGAYINELNSQCSEITKSNNYKNVITTSFDNIHFEFVHYFGPIIYLCAVAYLFRFMVKSNNFENRIFTFLIFIFLSLNFNLFEFMLLPFLLFIAVSSHKKTATPI